MPCLQKPQHHHTNKTEAREIYCVAHNADSDGIGRSRRDLAVRNLRSGAYSWHGQPILLQLQMHCSGLLVVFPTGKRTRGRRRSKAQHSQAQNWQISQRSSDSEPPEWSMPSENPRETPCCQVPYALLGGSRRQFPRTSAFARRQRSKAQHSQWRNW